VCDLETSRLSRLKIKASRIIIIIIVKAILIEVTLIRTGNYVMVVVIMMRK
jgi:hypothetical protein